MDASLAKLKALKGRVTAAVEYHWNVRADLFENMQNQFLKEAEKVMKVYPDMSDFVPHSFERYVVHNEGQVLYKKPASYELIQDIDFFIEFLLNLSSDQPAQLEVSEEGMYLKGQHFDALLKINELVAKATGEIVLIDNYVDGKLLDLLGAKNPGVKCRVLTKSSAITPILRVLVTAFNGQHGDLEVRPSAIFHDRFLILDGTSFYHFGASLKDAGRKGFMFSKIEQESLRKALWTEFEAEWKVGATPTS